MKIAVDMDEVLCSLHEHWFNIHNSRYVKNPKDAIHPDQAKDWGMGTVPLKCSLTDMMAILNEKTVFLNLTPKPGAIAAINKMIDDGHEIMLVTACPFQYAMAEKLAWVSRHVPKLTDRVIGVPSSSSKPLVLGMFDIVIDDNPEILVAVGKQPYKSTITRILIDAPYNEFSEANSVYEYRAASLAEAEAIVSGIHKAEKETAECIFKCFKCMSNAGVSFNEKTQELSCAGCNFTAHQKDWNDAQRLEKKLRVFSLVELGESLHKAKEGVTRLVETELNGSEFIYRNRSENIEC